MSRTVATVKVDVFDVEGMDVAWNITEKGQTDVDKEIKSTAGDHGHTDWREKDGDEDDQEGGSCVRHCDGLWSIYCSSVGREIIDQVGGAQ